MCFVTVCWVVAGKPCVLLLFVGWWLESHVFCYCLLGGGWQAMCFVIVCWVVAGEPYGMKKKNVVFVCCFFGSALDST